MPKTVTFYVVSYDISDDRTRRKVAKTMENYGRRVQFSVFECRLSTPRFREMYGKLITLCMKPGDSIRMYTICEDCISRIHMIGVKEPAQEEDTVIII